MSAKNHSALLSLLLISATFYFCNSSVAEESIDIRGSLRTKSSSSILIETDEGVKIEILMTEATDTHFFKKDLSDLMLNGYMLARGRFRADKKFVADMIHPLPRGGL